MLVPVPAPMGEDQQVSKDKPHKADCRWGPDNNHVFQKTNKSDDEFRCTYCGIVQYFDVWNREWKE